MLINLYSLFSNILYLPILLFFIFRFFFSRETLRSLNEKFGSYKQIKPYKKNKSDILFQINKYNEINDIIKTLEVMN